MQAKNESQDTGNHYDFIRNVYFFNGLTDDEILCIGNVCHKQKVNMGDIICKEGSEANRFFIILSGAVEVWKDYYQSEPDLLAVHGPGHLFGEMALVDELPRSATVIAREKSELLYIYRDDFQRIIKENSSIALSIMKSVSAMVRKSNESFVEGLREKNQKLEIAYKELQEAQEELLRSERLSAIGKFSSLILHDIRNPLSVIRGYAEMICLNTNDTERVKTSARKIVNEADRINHIANELLDYSRGELRLNISIVKIKELITQFIESINEKFKARGISIINEVSFDGPVLLDRERILRMLYNLADNSRKAMPQGGVLKIKVYNKDKTLIFELMDSGEGMSGKVLKNIFEPFFSYSKSGGTGLGMCIVKSIVDAHEGRLRVFSKQDKGTKFQIAIPIMN
jgi:signal transduction histidine kinase